MALSALIVMHKIGEGKKDERMRGMGGTSVRARGPSGSIFIPSDCIASSGYIVCNNDE